jgi:hypothetical protein
MLPITAYMDLPKVPMGRTFSSSLKEILNPAFFCLHWGQLDMFRFLTYFACPLPWAWKGG